MNEIFFISSSSIKMNHIRYLFRQYDVKVSPQRNYGIGYIEPRIKDREQLHHDSLRDARMRWGKTISKSNDKMFFIEDTSVIIDCLSEGADFPGVDVKYWMRENDFKSVDDCLKAKGNNRGATVRSDVLLYIPVHLLSVIDTSKYPPKLTVDGDAYITFTSSVDGEITREEFSFSTNALYPWLDNKTFNKWFVPRGETKPLGMLPIHIADVYDFRRPAFEAMLEFLFEHKLIRKKEVSQKADYNHHFKFFNSPLLLVCGPPCAGKTTLGIHLALRAGYYHIEASDFMFLSYYQRHGTKSSVFIGDFAEKALMDTPTIVVDQILKHVEGLKSLPLIISGFRSPDEVDAFILRYTGPHGIKCLFIDSEPFTRFSRSQNRGRYDKVVSFKKFLERDHQQDQMGLGRIKKIEDADVIRNEGTLSSYLHSVMSKYGIKEVTPKDFRVIKQRPRSLEISILIALLLSSSLSEFLTTTSIAKVINDAFPTSSLKANKNNVSRYFNQCFYPYYEIGTIHNIAAYRLSETGISHALYVLGQQAKAVKGGSDYYDIGSIFRAIISRYESN